MGIAAMVLALLAGILYLVAALGGSLGSVDLVIIGHALVAFAIAAMNLPAVRVR
jgi:hypothetical protein